VIDHISIGVSDLERARAFYDAVLFPLGYSRLSDDDHSSGYGNERDEFTINAADAPKGTSPAGHIAFTAPGRSAVQDFYDAALQNGAGDNGAPGLRPNYHENYYAAFVIDPDGHKLEAVCYRPEPQT
jgi:catechol 2,3-dioxygenase-like lactoylglutathione lyase family enzyme